MLYVISLGYIALGVFVFIKKWFLTYLDDLTAVMLGILFTAYGAFRLFRAYQSSKEEH
ncbi:MAG: C4-dicarboxylate ABC transporter [Cytophagaceae bacterium]|nr:C4-dicarboxylate ABC transporter [Cytophagaceae bacterium]MBK9510614.1 C4-dicarboxylate ABC transporter [Cytophagaceae bacterium]MBK9934379.1 C4-dicarboxylate ABC transporter [Cytophagaceae bacterium]MBL0300828.1 C4-dicarboxylate ABC transporter [Cytophagaceae bacterium]MBL0327771.1 C4-dicarboxylate ABC transporter [Cytophagaceae bacterium]